MNRNGMTDQEVANGLAGLVVDGLRILRRALTDDVWNESQLKQDAMILILKAKAIFDD